MSRNRRITIFLAAVAGLGLSGCAADQNWQTSRIHTADGLFEPEFLMASLARYQNEMQLADETAVPAHDFRPLRIAASDSLGQTMYTQHMFYGFAYAGTVSTPADEDEAVTLAK